MKKLAIVLTCMGLFLFLTSNAAKSKWCGYQDTFSLWSPSSNNLQILGVSSKGGLEAHSMDPQTLVVRDVTCDDGTVTVTVGINETTYTTFSFNDGPDFFPADVAHSYRPQIEAGLKLYKFTYPTLGHDFSLCFDVVGAQHSECFYASKHRKH